MVNCMLIAVGAALVKMCIRDSNRAYLQVVRNKGAEGMDGMKYTELKEHLEKNGEIIKEQLRTRKYKPQPCLLYTSSRKYIRTIQRMPISLQVQE